MKYYSKRTYQTEYADTCGFCLGDLNITRVDGEPQVIYELESRSCCAPCFIARTDVAVDVCARCDSLHVSYVSFIGDERMHHYCEPCYELYFPSLRCSYCGNETKDFVFRDHVVDCGCSMTPSIKEKR